MRFNILLAFILFYLSTYAQSSVSKLTVIIYDSQNPNSKVSIDTLVNAKEIDLSNTAIDLYFTHKNFHLPYYVPTGGIFRNSEQEKECDMKIYPKNVKCYVYDEINRVVKMSVNGSGTMNNFAYLYNSKNQITEISDMGIKILLKYNVNGTLKELTQTGIIKKKLIFIYN